jgi:hypothetical protein
MAVTINASTSAGLVQTADTSGVLQLQTNSGTTALTIDTSQNVGIGTASPSQKFHVQGGGVLINNGSSAGTVYFVDTNAYINYVGSTMQFAVNGSERMRIDSSGNTMIGTQSVVGSARLTATNTSGTARISIESGSSSGSDASLYVQCSGVGAGEFAYQRSTSRIVVINNGTNGVYLASGGTSWVSNSDERKKDIIEPITDAANKISTLRAVIGKYKTDEEGTRRAFLIAQDVQAVLPEAVDAKDSEDLGVAYTDVIPLLVAAIKEQQTIINDLKARVETLEAK